MTSLAMLARDRWLATCTVPRHPDRCPQCAAKVRIYHTGLENKAMFMCKNKECLWPIMYLAPEMYEGVSDYTLHHLWQVECGKKGESDEDEDLAPAEAHVVEAEAASEPPSQIETTPSQSGEKSDSPEKLAQEESFEASSPEKQEPDALTSQISTFEKTSPDQDRSAAANKRTQSETKQSEEVVATDDEDLDAIFSHVRPSWPNAMSPMSASVAPSPQHDWDSGNEFRRPTPSHLHHAGASSPWSLNRTPIHVPSMLSPLQSTPKRRYDDFNSDSDSVVSEQLTPRPERDLPAAPEDDGGALPVLSLKKSQGQRWSLSSKSSSGAEEEPQVQQQEPIKMTLKRHLPDDERPPLPNTKLDKVVSSLKKKTAGGSHCRSILVAETPGPTVLANVKPQRQGRKSKSAPVKKIQHSKLVETSVETVSAPQEPLKIEENSKHRNKPILSEKIIKRRKKETSNGNILKLPQQVTPNKPQFSADKAVKTYCSSTVRSNGVRLESLSNKLAMATGLPISISFELPPPALSTEGAKTKSAPCRLGEIAKLTRKVSAFEENREFRTLIKAMGGTDKDNLEFVQKLQKTILGDASVGTTTSNVVTLHVGLNKGSINLPSSETLDVSGNNDSVRVLFCSESDGIEGEVLRKQHPPTQPAVQQPIRKPRGRPKKVRPPSPSPTMVPSQSPMTGTPYRFSPNLPREDESQSAYLQQLHQQQQSYYNFFCNPLNLEAFTNVINKIREECVLPDQFRTAQAIDPTFAILFYQMNEQMHNNPDSITAYQRLIEMYGHYTRFLAQQQSAFDQEPMNLSRGSSSVENNRPIYHELQTVRGRENATEVLREHQSSSEANDDDGRRRKSTAEVNQETVIIKQEAVECPIATPFNPDSVVLSSVHPGQHQLSVQEVSGHLPVAGVVGRGSRVLNFTYENCNFSVSVETEEETKVLVAFVQERIANKLTRGKDLTQSPQFSSDAVRARSILSAEVIKYVERAFTQKGLKENIVGRKRRNYPKRSAIIKINPKTNEVVQPADKAIHIMTIKQEIADEEKEQRQQQATAKRQRLLEGASGGSNSKFLDSYLPPTPVMEANINQILSNTEDSTTCIDLEPENSETCLEMTTIKPSFLDMGSKMSFLEVPEEKSKKIRTTRSTTSKSEKASSKKEVNKRLVAKKPVISSPPIEFKQTVKSDGSPLLTKSNLSQMQEKDRIPVLPKSDGPVAKQCKIYRGFQSKSTLGPEVKTKSQSIMSPPANRIGIPQKENGAGRTSMEDEAGKILSIAKNSDGSSNGRVAVAAAAVNRGRKKSLQQQTSPPNAIDPSKLLTRNQSKIVESQNLTQSIPPSTSVTVAPVVSSKPVTTTTISNVFVRHNQEKRLEKLLKKQMKKKNYKGFGKSSTISDNKVTTNDSKAHAPIYTPARVIGGVKRVMKANGEIVEIAASTEEQQPSQATTSVQSVESASKRPPKYVAPIEQEEKDLLDELFKIASDMPGDYDRVSSSSKLPMPPPPPSKQSDVSRLAEMEMAMSYMPPSFDDLM